MQNVRTSAERYCLEQWLSYVRSLKWLILTGVMGLNLLQSAFTNWCPMMPVLRKLGLNGKKQEGGVK
ncbi:MAG: DUF2892 domain-containing protein [Candidatus Desantisbacteria bacterium]